MNLFFPNDIFYLQFEISKKTLIVLSKTKSKFLFLATCSVCFFTLLLYVVLVEENCNYIEKSC